jgi:HSF-type DNA-binding
MQGLESSIEKCVANVRKLVIRVRLKICSLDGTERFQQSFHVFLAKKRTNLSIRRIYPTDIRREVPFIMENINTTGLKVESYQHDNDETVEKEDGSEGGESLDDGNGQHHPIAEFLYQLTKMLTDDNNEIIEWIDGRIKVHYPERLEGEVLHKYFRHSKFASFQRQLNYFGFRKIAGKGKMSPCSYVNEGATSDIRSLLLIKRKTNGSAARKAALQQQRAAALANSGTASPFVLPQSLAGFNMPSLNFSPNMFGDQQALSNALALLNQNTLNGGIGQIGQGATSANPSQHLNSVGLQQLNLLTLQHQHQLLQKQLLNQQNFQAQQNQAALNMLQSTQNSTQNGTQSSFPSNFFKPNVISQQTSGTNTTSFEQLQAQLKALSQQQQQQQQQNIQQHSTVGNATNVTAFLTQVAANQVAANQAAANQAASANTSLNRATAALNAQQVSMPATAAMNAAASMQTNSNNLFDSAINLKSLLEEHKVQTEQQQQQIQQNAAAHAILNRLPSQPGLMSGENNFNNNMSTLSFGNMLGSSNRLSSLMSLNSFLGSRETSLADFAAAIPANVRDQLTVEAVTAQISAAAAAAAGAAAAQHEANKYRSNTNS